MGLILDLYVEGQALKKICTLGEMPNYRTVLRWIRDNPEIRDQFQKARAARAIDFEERALELAENLIGKDDAVGERLRFDIFKWAAEVGDPTQYGKKVTVGGDDERPIVFKVITGVPDPIHLASPGLGLPAPLPVITVDGSPVESSQAAQEPAGAVHSELLERLAAERGVVIPDERPALPDAEQDLT